MPDDEGLSVARGEGDGGLSDADFGTGGLGCVSTDEVVHNLFLGQLRNRRENAKSIASKQNDVLGVSSNGGDLSIGDEFEGIGATGVLSDRNVVVVNLAILLVKDDILQDGSEPDSSENFRLFLLCEIDALGIAATLNVENSVVCPDVLVITDQGTLGISRECGLSGTRETEEQCNISGLTLRNELDQIN